MLHGTGAYSGQVVSFFFCSLVGMYVVEVGYCTVGAGVRSGPVPRTLIQMPTDEWTSRSDWCLAALSHT